MRVQKLANIMQLFGQWNCVVSVQIGIFSGSYFPAFGLNTEIYSINHRILSKFGKIRTRKNFDFGHLSDSVMYTETVKARIHSETFLSGHLMKHDILSWNTFTLAFKFHCVRFSSIKNMCLQKKDIL